MMLLAVRFDYGTGKLLSSVNGSNRPMFSLQKGTPYQGGTFKILIEVSATLIARIAQY
jgi:hypothetical protein